VTKLAKLGQFEFIKWLFVHQHGLSSESHMLKRVVQREADAIKVCETSRNCPTKHTSYYYRGRDAAISAYNKIIG
jgi:phage antirepressor YoqD-like protein